MDEAEIKEVNEIVFAALNRDYSKNQNMAVKMMHALAKQLQDPGSKLVHFGNFVFQTTVKGKGLVEIHMFSKELGDRQGMAEAFGQLAQYLRNIGVTAAYAVTEDTRLAEVAKITGIPFKNIKVDIPNTKGKANAYYVEL
jgi:hypothetical protein